MKGPCRRCEPTKVQKKADEAPQKNVIASWAKLFMSKVSPSSATKGPQQPPATPHRITHRQQRRRSRQSSTKSGHLALPLELRDLHIILCRPIWQCDAGSTWIRIVITMHSALLSAALQLHLIAHLHLAKAVVRNIQMLQRLVGTKDISKGLGTSSAHSTI